MIKLLITNSKGTFDITQLIDTITWSGHYLQCARTLDFGLISTYTDKSIPTIDCELGNAVTFLQDERVLFTGYVFERQKDTGSSTIDINCYDRGIYLKKNQANYKFTNITPEAITKKVCSDFGIEVGSIISTGTSVTRNFIGVNLYSIIQTAYTLASEKTGKHYMIRFHGSKLNVIEKTKTEETLIIEGGNNLMSASTSESISDMINQVAIYNKDDTLVKILKNDEAIKLYGLMQGYIKQPEKEDVTDNAKKILADNGVKQTITINNLGNIANVTGGTVVVREPYTGLYGLFYIDADVHTWKLGQYYNKLTLNFKNIMDEQEAGSLPNKDGKKTKGETFAYNYKPGRERENGESLY
ncbi:MAG: hypothetical protein K0R00_3220 [Herbinix sp.]|jgi:predicted lactoylglutathione lyase|nr:hypothetical protein [Herbinix sp.]